MPRKLLLTHEDGTRPVLEQVQARDEVQLQTLIRDRPELLPYVDLKLDEPVVVVGKETPLPSGYVDLILLGRGGDLCLVEFKTGPTNPDFRAVLAQLLDYGSDLWKMSVDEFEAKVAVQYFNSRECPADAPGHRAKSLSDVLQNAWSDIDHSGESWRDRLGLQLQKGRFRYVAVAQRFTDPVLRTIEYLNDSSSGSEYYAVELIRFRSPHDATEAFEARVVGGPSSYSNARRKPNLADRAEFLEQVPAGDYRQAVDAFLEGVEAAGILLKWGSAGTPLHLGVPGRSNVLSVGWVFPPGASRWMGLTDVTLGYYSEGVQLEPELSKAIDRYVERVRSVSGATPTRSKTLTAWTFGADAFPGVWPELVEAVRALVDAVGH